MTKFIYNKVETIIKKYNTRNPFKLCTFLDINVYYSNLGSVLKGYYFYQSRIKNIVLNSQIDGNILTTLCAHELGHALLHSNFAAAGNFHDTEFLNSIVPTEFEANLFAAELIISDEQLLCLINDYDTSFFSIAKKLCVPAEILSYKLKMLRDKGLDFNLPVLPKSNFLKYC